MIHRRKPRSPQLSLLHKLLMNSRCLFLTEVGSPAFRRPPKGRTPNNSWEKSSIRPFFSLTRECARVTFFDTLFNSPKTAFERLCPPPKITAEATQPERVAQIVNLRKRKLTDCATTRSRRSV